MTNLLPHDSVGWFLFLLWIGLAAFFAGILSFCAMQAIWQWFAGREERHHQRHVSSLREHVSGHGGSGRRDENHRAIPPS
jgi:hypothetical protein